MPELPEVETVRRGLAPWITGKKIKKIETLHPRATRTSSTIALKRVEGARVIEVTRRGKFLWFVLDRDLALVGHLGMSGQMLIVPKRSELEKHARIRIDFGDKSHELRFVDQRTFGWMSAEPIVSIGERELPECCAHIAPDVFAEDFNKKLVITNLRRRNIEIKKALLNQEIMSGVGNIYADEALWQAKVHPERLSSSLNEQELDEILRAVKKVMKSALKQGGTSFDDLYINVNGESGYFEVSLRAYGREDEPCHRCGTLIKRISFANRSSHFCPNCQRGRKSRKLAKKPG